jgi:hypothetical protein
MPIKNNVDDLREKVSSSLKKLKDLKIKNARWDFIRKYPEYGKEEDVYRLENLWYGKSTDEDFTTKLESFVKYKETEFK